MPGPVKVRRELATRRESFVALTLAAEERLFAQAEVLTEGAMRRDRGGTFFYGTTIISFDVAEARRLLRGLDGEDGAAELCALVEGSVRVRLRAMRIACAEAARRVPEHDLGTARVEVRVRRDGEMVHVDVDLEARADLRLVGGNT